MADKSDNPFKFWEELKRRKVIRVIIGYLPAAYVILELTSIIEEPFGLPPGSIKLVFVLLCVGFIIAVSLSWIYDFTSEGIKKTESLKVVKLKVEPTKPDKWKLKASDIIIAVLIVVVLIMVYPKVLRSDKSLASMTLPTTFLNEFGEEETRQIFKDDFIHRLMIFPFDAEESDSSNLWLSLGITDAAWWDLSQFNYVIANKNIDAVHLQEQINAAKRNNCSFFLTGTFSVIDDEFRIITELYSTGKGALERKREYIGDNFFEIIDSISVQSRTDIGVSPSLFDYCPDLPFTEYATSILDAYKYYVLGYYYYVFRQGYFYVNYNNALDCDSTFALALWAGASDAHNYQESSFSANKYIDKAINHINKIPDNWKAQVWSLYYSIQGDKEKAVALSEIQHKLKPTDIDVILKLVGIYQKYELYNDAHAMAIKLNELVPDSPNYQFILAKTYILTNNIKEGIKFIEECLEEQPQNTNLLLRKGQLYLHQGNYNEAEQIFQEAIFLSPENREKWSLLLEHINYIKLNPYNNLDLTKYTGYYRQASNEYTIKFSINHDYLIRKAENQVPTLHYPISDTSLVGMLGNHHITFQKGESQDFIQASNKQNTKANLTISHWKLDSLTCKANELYEAKDYSNSLLNYKKAYENNPEHRYIKNYIKHLEYIQSSEYSAANFVREEYEGTYEGGIKVFSSKQKDQLIVMIEVLGIEAELLPLSKNEFFTKLYLEYVLEFVWEGSHVSGVKVIASNGTEEFLKK